MKIYMVKSKQYGTIRGLWTDVNKMADWVADQTHGFRADGKTRLDEFMETYRVIAFDSDVDSTGHSVYWSEFFPTE